MSDRPRTGRPPFDPDDPRIQRGTYRNINSARVFVRREGRPNPDGRYVLYWMQIHRRLHHNHALEYAVGWANALNKPLLIFEALRCDYPWASDRCHAFILQGMAEHAYVAKERALNYFPYLEARPGDGQGLLEVLAQDAALVVSDEFPAYIIPGHNRGAEKILNVPFVTIDANGLIPLGLSEKAPYSAYLFRKILQTKFIEAYEHAPREHPLDELKNTNAVQPPAGVRKRWPGAQAHLANESAIAEFVAGLNSLDHNIPALKLKGGRAAGVQRLRDFVRHRLDRYGADRNDPDVGGSSGLSPYLHFGQVSAFEIVHAVLRHQPEGWDYRGLKNNKGSKGFFSARIGGVSGSPDVDDFLDEALTWRETGYHFCHHEPEYDRFDSLPDWVRTTLNAHADDPREYVYDLEDFANARTHNEVWNAAQRQLATEGIIHNYLRMVWGKKIVEWTAHPREALEIMIELNNRYAIDGRNPNSYSGIFWVLGRFDRPWQEREIFGTIRYMSTASARKKVRMDECLKRYGDAPGLAFR